MASPMLCDGMKVRVVSGCGQAIALRLASSQIAMLEVRSIHNSIGRFTCPPWSRKTSQWRRDSSICVASVLFTKLQGLLNTSAKMQKQIGPPRSRLKKA